MMDETSDGCLDLVTLPLFRAGVISLYRDQIRPTHADISRRLVEMGCLSITLGEMMELACETVSEFVVVVDDDLQICIELKRAPDWFVGWIDPLDPDLTYSIELWGLFDHFVAHECRSFASFQVKGGRYGLARRLTESIPHPECIDCMMFRAEIDTFTIGRLSHFVQRAICLGKFRYENNFLQPSACCRLASAALASKLVLDDDCASKLIRTLPKTKEIITEEVNSLEELYTYIRLLLFDNDHLPLSELKKRMIDEYGVVLNPVKFGFTKLLDLIQSVNFLKIIQNNNSFILKLVDNCPLNYRGQYIALFVLIHVVVAFQ